MRNWVALSLLLAVSVTGCQGSFGQGGTSAPGGINPPMNPQQQVNPDMQKNMPSPMPSPSASALPGPGAHTYDFAQASEGFACPSEQGFSCVLRFNIKGDVDVSPSPSASPGKHATPSPSPTPTPTPSPTPSPTAKPSGAASPSPSPASNARITLDAHALPKDAPKMANPDPKAVATVALMTVTIRADHDVVLEGNAIADFTLPKEQIGGRGFALQLFKDTSSKHHHSQTFFGSYSKSNLHDDTLRFELTLPKVQVKKDETWMLVLYGDELPSASPSAHASASPHASSSPGASASPEPEASAAASTEPEVSATP